MIVAFPLKRRYEVGHIPNDEQIAGIGLEYDGRIDPGIRTSDKGHFGPLALVHKIFVRGALFLELAIAKDPETCGELGD
jgi:hypothetical protein